MSRAAGRTMPELDRLRRQGMPEDEIRSILAATDTRIVRRHLELHRERLTERAVEERRAVDRVEESLISQLRWT